MPRAWGGSWGIEGNAGGPSQLGGYGGLSWPLNPFHWAPLGRPLAPLLILTDRDDGTEWFLSHAADGAHLAIVSGAAYPRYGRMVAFGPYDGPYLFKQPDTYLRLLVRGGYLGYEACGAYNSPPVNTRRGLSRDYHLLYIPTTWVEGGNLAFDAA